MIIEGIKLMFIGMTVVMLFLGLLVYAIGLVARLTKKSADRELEALRLERELLKKRNQAQTAATGSDDIAAISAAVAAYEAERYGLRR